jgi:cellulose synthase/poly-beta-1,6-N-acetylglucosamine synthase-like glycosyltransferase
MDIQGVIPLPVEDACLILKSPYLFWKGRKLEKGIRENGKWSKVSILMAFFVREGTRPDPVIKAVKSIYQDGYPCDKIQLIIIVNGENPPNPPSGKDVVEEKRKEIEDALKKCQVEGVIDFFTIFNDLTLVTNHSNVGNKAIPLNVGFKQVSPDSEYVLTIDPDGEIEPGSLKRLITHFLMDKDKKVGAVGGTITVRDGCREKDRKENLFTRWDFLTAEYSTRILRNVYSPYLYHISGGISAFRKDVLEQIGQEETSHFLNGVWTSGISKVYHEGSVTEDQEITEEVLDLGKKVVHEDKATYYGPAPNSFREQFDRFRRWYGGYCQNRSFKRRLNCKSTIWAKFSRGGRAFSAHWYSYFWFFILFLFVVHLLFSMPPGRGLFPFPLIEEDIPLWRQFTFIGGIWSIWDFMKLLLTLPVNQWWPTAFEPLYWWIKFPHIYLAEVSLCIVEFLLLTFLSMFIRKIERGWSLLSFIPYAIFLPFAIIFVNRIYWFIFSIYGRVSHKKLAW